MYDFFEKDICRNMMTVGGFGVVVTMLVNQLPGTDQEHFGVGVFISAMTFVMGAVGYTLGLDRAEPININKL